MKPNSQPSKREEDNFDRVYWMRQAFLAGFTASRHRGDARADLKPISERAATSLFEQWYQAHRDSIEER